MINYGAMNHRQILLACYEYHQYEKEVVGQFIEDQDDVLDLFLDLLSGCQSQDYYGIYLDHHHRVLSIRLIHKATETQPIFDLKGAIAPAFKTGAVAMILVHNHPGESIDLSTQEIHITGQLKVIAENLGICLVDHLIISSAEEYCYFSFAADDEGLTCFNEI